MNIAILGSGVEGKALKEYFLSDENSVRVFDNFSDEDLKTFQLEDFDLVFRSPSVRPLDSSWSSMTKYFFDHKKSKVIGVTGTKGKGTTCSLIKAILEEIIKNSEWTSRNVYLVGNIGNPSIKVLDQATEDDIIVFEMSSFQLWDLEKSPEVAVVLRVEQDHLDRHFNLEDYHNAKANIARYQTPDNCCVFYNNNETSEKIGKMSEGTKLTYPVAKTEKVIEILDSLNVPGEHNRENLEAALLAVASFFKKDLNEFLNDAKIFENVKTAVKNFQGLPHRIQFVRELNGVRYFDDNYSSAFPALDVALKTFEKDPIILIAGGKDRGLDLTEMKRRIFDTKNLKKVILIGETAKRLSENEDPEKFEIVETLEDAVNEARALAEKIADDTGSNYDLCLPVTNPLSPVVLMSPGAASFDMFENFEDRGKKFQAIVNKM
ncbi:UDP-N-acetylmuramoyl-L-alanine--D-glutamate ligase [Candidatus Saccharibacteria bacterium]|nr:UDP-N-acetylmuramoyl-L-alanine--D-glutamate ligase [Candidatus Saccharibacteria bacterium]